MRHLHLGPRVPGELGLDPRIIGAWAAILDEANIDLLANIQVRLASYQRKKPTKNA